MNREIKFRGKRTYSGEWVYGHYTQNANTHHYITNPDGSVWQIDPDAVGQFTGEIIDKKEVYVGDTIAVFKGDIEYFRGNVTDHGVCGYTIDKKSDYMDFQIMGLTYKIIGNRHDNPELL